MRTLAFTIFVVAIAATAVRAKKNTMAWLVDEVASWPAVNIVEDVNLQPDLSRADNNKLLLKEIASWPPSGTIEDKPVEVLEQIVDRQVANLKAETFKEGYPEFRLLANEMAMLSPTDREYVRSALSVELSLVPMPLEMEQKVRRRSLAYERETRRVADKSRAEIVEKIHEAMRASIAQRTMVKERQKAMDAMRDIFKKQTEVIACMSQAVLGVDERISERFAILNRKPIKVPDGAVCNITSADFVTVNRLSDGEIEAYVGIIDDLHTNHATSRTTVKVNADELEKLMVDVDDARKGIACMVAAAVHADYPITNHFDRSIFDRFDVSVEPEYCVKISKQGVMSPPKLTPRNPIR